MFLFNNNFLLVALSIVSFSFKVSLASSGDDLDVYKPERLGINLIWLNEGKLYGDFVFPSSQKGVIVKSLKDWTLKHEETSTTFSFWYDGRKMTGDSQLEATKQMLVKELGVEVAKRVVLRDTSVLPAYKTYASFFESNIPIYFQTDILRFLLGKHCLATKECDTYLYADLNVTAQNQKELFIPQTSRLMNDFSFVILRHRYSEHSGGGLRGFENKFTMMRQDENLMKSLDEIFLKPLPMLIKEIENTGLLYNVDHTKFLEQIIYSGIQALSVHLFHQKGQIYVEAFDKELNWRDVIYYGRDGTSWLYGLKIKKSKEVEETLHVGDLEMLTRAFYWTQEDIDGARVDLEEERVELQGMQSEREAKSEKLNTLNKTDEKDFKNEDEWSAFKSYKKGVKKELNKLDRKLKRASQSVKWSEKDIEEMKALSPKLTWPHDLPMPLHRMQAPRSHFG